MRASRAALTLKSQRWVLISVGDANEWRKLLCLFSSAQSEALVKSECATTLLTRKLCERFHTRGMAKEGGDGMEGRERARLPLQIRGARFSPARRPHRDASTRSCPHCQRNMNTKRSCRIQWVRGQQSREVASSTRQESARLYSARRIK